MFTASGFPVFGNSIDLVRANVVRTLKNKLRTATQNFLPKPGKSPD